ncbi:unnamed protein product [Microthlaspi erraticum]|uniref:PHD-type domain-containing protein n=1 Tax=Microthlaspi erraticum TaxID=1685480 RepID=A0A6D2I9N2_9BRAS|nr:unnamed protein product [Microthlaspi erraticum]
MATVCQICGDSGFEVALVYCDSCKIAAMHCYCLGITPVPFEEYITWFCEECDVSDCGSDGGEVDMTTKLRDILKKKKSSSQASPVKAAEEVFSSPTIVETMKESEGRERLDNGKSDELNGLVRNEATVSEKVVKEKRKKKKKKRKSIDQSLPALPLEDHELPDAIDVEPVLVSNEGTVLEAGDGTTVLGEGEKEKKKKKKKRKSIDHTLPVEDHAIATNVEPVEVSTKQQSSEELNGLVRNEGTVLEAGDGASASEKEKKKKKKRRSIDHSLPALPVEDQQLPVATNVEPGEVSEKRQSSEVSNGLVGNEATVLEAGDGATVLGEGEKEKKKKKKKRKSIDHTLPVSPVDDHVLLDATIVEPVEVSKKRKSSEELRNEASTSKKGEKGKKKKKRKSTNHSLPVLPVEDNELPDDTNAEPMEVSKKRKSSEELNDLERNEASVLEMIEKKKKKKNGESSKNTLPVLAVEDHELQATNKGTTHDSERREHNNGKSHELSGLAKSAASYVSEAGNSSTVPDYSSCTSKKRKLSSGNIRVTSANTQLDAEENTCREAESNMPQTSEKLTATDYNSPVLYNDRAQPILEPTWRGSISIKNRNVCNIDGLVAHLSSLACYQVHEKASSLHGRLYAEMVPRLDIWPKSFLNNGGPMDDSIAFYFFPSSESDSNQEAVFYSLVREMKKDDSAMRCVLDNVELILFTSYQLPLHCWTFYSKEYLWGAFRPRKTSRH